MRLLFLGTGGYHPNEERHTACLMLPEIGVLFDAGTSFFRVPRHLETEEVRIFLTHAHLDHVVGLTYFLVPLLRGQVKRALIYGTASTLKAVREHLFAPEVFPVLPEFEFIELTGEVNVPGGGTVRHMALEHPGGSTGYRLDFPDRSLAYITDTTASESYLEFVHGVDVLVHECYFTDDMAEWAEKTGHSNTTPVVQLAREADVGHLVLMHIDPYQTGDDPVGLEKARGIFAATEVAHDGMELRF